jgi:predicted ATPase
VLYGRLTVFVGGWSLEAAEDVCAFDEEERACIIDRLQQLIEQNLVWAKDGRFGMLETIREFTHEKLSETGESHLMAQRHAQFYLTLAEEGAQYLEGVGETAWLDELELEHDNLRAAERWSLETNQGDAALRFGVALRLFWFMRGHLTEGRAHLDQAVGCRPGARHRRQC